MKYMQQYSAIIISLIFLEGCGYSKKKNVAMIPAILPIIDADAIYQLSDQQVTDAVKEYLKGSNAPVYSRYGFMRVDLNKDGSQDALVYITAPYGKWCGVRGCTVLMLHAKRHGFVIVGEEDGIRPPLYISDIYTNNWRDVIVYISGNTDKAKYSAFKFDGNTYKFNGDALSYDFNHSYRKAFP